MPNNGKYTVKSNMLWNLAGSIIYLGCQWLVTLFVVALSCSLDNAGSLNLAISITAIFGTAAAFNMRTYIISDTENSISSRTYTGFRFLTCAISFVICLIYTVLFRYTISQFFCIAIYMLFRIGEAILDLFYAFEQRSYRMDIGAKSMMMRGILSLASFTLIIYLTDNLLLSLTGMVTVTYTVIILYDYPEAKHFANLKPTISREYKTLLKDGSIITSTSFISDWIITLPRQFIESIMGNAMLGAYATVSAPIILVQVGSSLIFNPLLPEFDKYYKSRDKNAYFLLFKKTIIYMSLISLSAFIIILAFGYQILELLYGSEVAQLSYLLPSFLAITCINAFQWFLRILLVMSRVLLPQLCGVTIGFFICMLFSVPLIQKFGLMGANYIIISCYSISCLITLVAFLIHTKRHFKQC